MPRVLNVRRLIGTASIALLKCLSFVKLVEQAVVKFILCEPSSRLLADSIPREKKSRGAGSGNL